MGLGGNHFDLHCAWRQNTAGMKRQAEVEELNARSLGHLVALIFCNPLVLGGIGALFYFFFCVLIAALNF